MTNDPLASMSLGQFVSAVASKEPTPGGGSVAGFAGALAAALGQMSLSFTTGKKKFAQHEPLYTRLGARMEKARAMFMQLMAEDIEAYSMYSQATKAGATGDDPRLQLALAAAIDVPREMAKLALALLEDLAELSDKCSKWLVSDLGAAGAMAVAVARMSAYNVRINVPGLTDRQAADDLLQAAAQDAARAQHLLDKIEEQAIGPHVKGQ